MSALWFIAGCITGTVCTLLFLWCLDAAYELAKRDRR